MKKGQTFLINFEDIHHSPFHYPEPERFIPERFSTSSVNNKWILNADGKPRSPLAFTPFMGGKRICIGKTFAEVAVRFTVPLIYHYFEIEFENPEV